MKNLIKLAYCGMLAFNVMAMEGLEDSTSRHRTSMSIEQVDSELDSAVSGNDLDKVVFLLRGEAGSIPSQGGVDHAFSWAASMKNRAILTFMVGHPTIRPTKDSIIKTYHREVENRNEAIAMLLEQEIFRLLRIERGEVTDTISLTDILPSLDERVAVFQNIYNMMRGIPLMAYELADYDARSALEQAIMSITPENQQEEVQVLLFNRIDANPGYQNQICTLLTFMQTFHPKHQQQWLEEFVREFGGGRGLKESIIRSLMNIDPELNSFFI